MKKKEKKNSRTPSGEFAVRWRSTLRWRLSFFVLTVFLGSALITGIIYVAAIHWFGRVPLIVALTVNPYVTSGTLLLICVIVGTSLSGFLGRYYLRPLKRLSRATKEVRKGNFKVRVECDLEPRSEMGQLIRHFNEMVRELDGIELFRNDFINSFSHEFKTPIVSIRGFARELQREDLSPDQRREYAGIIADEADRLARLSTNMLELSKLENQQILSNLTVFRLDEQLRQAILRLENEWSRADVEMVPELARVNFCSNEEMLAEVWTNLIGNAIKFTPPGGIITVRLTEEADHVTVSVTDTGIGMSPEVSAHIFEKFYQGDPSRNRSGYGVGLTIVEKIVNLCGGEIRVESAENEGSTFTVTLPKKEPPDPQAK